MSQTDAFDSGGSWESKSKLKLIGTGILEVCEWSDSVADRRFRFGRVLCSKYCPPEDSGTSVDPYQITKLAPKEKARTKYCPPEDIGTSMDPYQITKLAPKEKARKERAK